MDQLQQSSMCSPNMLLDDNKENSSPQFPEVWVEAFSSCQLDDLRMVDTSRRQLAELAPEFGNAVDHVGQYVQPVHSQVVPYSTHPVQFNQWSSSGVFYNHGYLENSAAMCYPMDAYIQNGAYPVAVQFG